MKRFRNGLIALAAFCVGAPGVASAALIDRGNGLIYDNVLDITWLANASQGGGFSSWTAAKSWADSLDYQGFTDWRLPSVYDPNGSTICVSYGCTNSELGHMYYNNLGVLNPNPISAGSNAANSALFTNLIDPNGGGRFALNEEFNSITAGPLPCPGCDLTPGSASEAFVFRNDGLQSYGGKAQAFQGWGVRDGDVQGPTAVPEPATWAMMIIGFGAAGSMIRRRKAVFA